MSLRSSTENTKENTNGERRHAGMDGRHPGAQDAPGDIHVAWIPALHAGMTELRSRTETDPGPFTCVFSREDSKHRKDSFYIFELRALRDLRVDIFLVISSAMRFFLGMKP